MTSVTMMECLKKTKALTSAFHTNTRCFCLSSFMHSYTFHFGIVLYFTPSTSWETTFKMWVWIWGLVRIWKEKEEFYKWLNFLCHPKNTQYNHSFKLRLSLHLTIILLAKYFLSSSGSCWWVGVGVGNWSGPWRHKNGIQGRMQG